MASEESWAFAVAGVAGRLGGTLRIGSFAVRPRTPLVAGIGSRAEASVLSEWAADVEQSQLAILEQVKALPQAPATVPPSMVRTVMVARSASPHWR